MYYILIFFASTYFPLFVFEDLGTLIVTLAMIGKMCIATTYAIAYNYSAEVFPTVVRNAGTGFSAMCGTIGSIAAPQIHLLVRSSLTFAHQEFITKEFATANLPVKRP